jgi:hypothetical protein
MKALSSALLALATAVAGAGVWAQEGQEQATPQSPEQIPAVLKSQEIDFFYRSSIAPFSCHALQGRVASIFSALGARNDIQVSVTGCDFLVQDEPANVLNVPSASDGVDGSSSRWRTPSTRFGTRSERRREQNSHVRVRLMTPVVVTDEVLAEIERDKSRRELVSRVTGNTSAALNDPIVFPAQRQLVTLSRKTVDLYPEDCELMEQMARSAFPKLGIRVVNRGRGCERNHISQIPITVVVEALMPYIPQGPQLSLPPAEEEKDPPK